MPSQPSPSRPARRIAASDRPPMMSGIGTGGAGAMTASSRSKNAPWKLTAVPAMSWRRTARHSFIRSPRVAGSTPHIEISWRSSPPTPTPKTSRAGSELGEVSELAGHQHGMAQRQQVNADVDGQRRMQHRQRRGLHEAVEPAAAKEAYVVAAADIVDARVRDLRQELPSGLLVLLEQAKRREHANPGGWSADSLCGIRHISTL